jgi:hypothetical protein
MRVCLGLGMVVLVTCNALQPLQMKVHREDAQDSKDGQKAVLVSPICFQESGSQAMRSRWAPHRLQPWVLGLGGLGLAWKCNDWSKKIVGVIIPSIPFFSFFLCYETGKGTDTSGWEWQTIHHMWQKLFDLGSTPVSWLRPDQKRNYWIIVVSTNILRHQQRQHHGPGNQTSYLVFQAAVCGHCREMIWYFWSFILFFTWF